jgi:hypothetical protein
MRGSAPNRMPPWSAPKTGTARARARARRCWGVNRVEPETPGGLWPFPTLVVVTRRRPEGELLFEAYLAEHDYPEPAYEPDLGVRTRPDYVVVGGETEAICEAEYGPQPGIEILAVSAASEAELRRSHGRYFLTSEELGERLVGAKL